MKPDRDALLQHLRQTERYTLLARRESTRLILQKYERARALNDDSLEALALTAIPLLGENLLEVLDEHQALQRLRDEIYRALLTMSASVEKNLGDVAEQEDT